MRILTLTNMYPKPGNPAFGIFVKRQVESLRAIGRDVRVLFIDGESTALQYAIAWPRTLHAIRTQAPDLIHAHYGLTGVPAALSPRVPFVLTLCGSDVNGKPGPGGLTLKSRVGRVLSRLVSRCAAALIVQSALMQDLMKRWGFASEVIPNGVDTNFFRPLDRTESRAQLGLAPNTRYVLFAASPRNFVKRFDLAQQMIRLLADRRCECQLLVVHGVHQTVLRRYYAAADVLILPSESEGSPNVLKEAMACELPTVAFDVGDAAWLAEGSARHKVVPRHDVHAMALAVEELLERSGEDGSSRGDARHKIVALLDESTIARRVDAVYQRVVHDYR